MSGFSAEIYMENFEKKAINTFIKPPTFWRRYVDDTIVKQKKEYLDQFLDHLNSIHPRIKFTHEKMLDNKIPFLDVEVHLKEDKHVKLKIYRKKTHTDQYLNFQSNHHISQKLGIISTFNHRIDTIITEESDKEEERKRVKKKMTNCNYPEWSLNRKKKKSKEQKVQKERKPTVTIPYVKTTSEKIARTLRKYGFEVIHKPSTTIKNRLCHLKDKVHGMEKSGPIYKISCLKHPKEKYVGETERGMKFRAYEHKVIEHKQVTKSWSTDIDGEGDEKEKKIEEARKSSRLREKDRINYARMNKDGLEENKEISETNIQSEVAQHIAESYHDKKDLKIDILQYEHKWWERGVLEAIHIRKEKPTLNANEGRFKLSKIWNIVINKENKNGRRQCSEEDTSSNITTALTQS